MCHRQCKTTAYAVTESYDQKINRACRTYCRQRIYAQKLPYNHGIYQIIELLE